MVSDIIWPLLPLPNNPPHSSLVCSKLQLMVGPFSSEKSTEEDGRKSNCSPREISEESKYKFNTESGFEVEEEV